MIVNDFNALKAQDPINDKTNNRPEIWPLKCFIYSNAVFESSEFDKIVLSVQEFLKHIKRKLSFHSFKSTISRC